MPLLVSVDVDLRGLWYVQHSSEKKRDKADTALVESGG